MPRTRPRIVSKGLIAKNSMAAPAKPRFSTLVLKMFRLANCAGPGVERTGGLAPLFFSSGTRKTAQEETDSGGGVVKILNWLA